MDDGRGTTNDSASEVSRRETLKALTICGCCVAGASVLLPGEADAQPAPGGGGGDRVAAAKPGKQDAGPITDFAKDGVYDAHTRTGQFFVSRTKDTIVAFSSICSHKRCVVRKQSDTLLKCPCHQAEFTQDGIVVKKPAPSSLVHFAVSLDEKQHLIVDTSKSFEEKKWDDPAASLKLSTATTQQAS